MSDEELANGNVKWTWVETSDVPEPAFRIEALTAERDRLRALLGEADRRITWEAVGFGNDFADQVQAVLKGETP